MDNLILSDNNKNENGKNSSFELAKFFVDLDNNLKNLKIKSYSASMPTFKEVFLNVVAVDSKIEDQKTEKKYINFLLQIMIMI